MAIMIGNIAILLEIHVSSVEAVIFNRISIAKYKYRQKIAFISISLGYFKVHWALEATWIQ
jgi:hypothetical protein